MLTHAEWDFLRSQNAAMASFVGMAHVPCHGDFKAHNWLVDSAGTLRVIDFGNSRYAPAASDFSRLFYGAWWRRPDLATAFFAGYGRAPSDEERAFIQSSVVGLAVAEIAFGRSRRRSRVEDAGRSRLADLMAGHQIRLRPTTRERVKRRLLRTVDAWLWDRASPAHDQPT
jgi:Ser/Thr protein kinase RdoA (MazF antagonist)